MNLETIYATTNNCLTDCSPSSPGAVPDVRCISTSVHAGQRLLLRSDFAGSEL